MISNDLISLLHEKCTQYRSKTENFLHVAAFVKHGYIRSNEQENIILSIGTNSDRKPYSGAYQQMHAEMEASKKYPKRWKEKRFHVDLIVLRVDKNGNYKISKPCLHCLAQLSRLGYCKIRKVYYSTENGCIISTRFSDLLMEKDPHISRGHRQKNNSNKRKFNSIK